MSIQDPQAEHAYNRIKDAKIKHGVNRKALFHLHTPQSHDYWLCRGWTAEKYRGKADKDLLSLCMERQIIPSCLSLEEFPLEGELSIYRDHKEWLSFVLLADAITENNIEIVVVTDHHSISGIDKLEMAIKHRTRMKAYNVYPEVISGIEISCADRLHVVGIFNNDVRKNVTDWLKENLLSEKDGTFRTSLDVMAFFDSIGGLSYIAHINTSDMYGENQYLSGAYKKTLLGSNHLKMVGVKDLRHKEGVHSFLSSFRGEQTNIIIDNDTHDIDSVDAKFMWLKGSKINYDMVKEALLDFDVSVSYSLDTRSKQTIKGIYIEAGGFLSGREDDGEFCLKFSDALNCLIGGRGTGKSTVLQIIDYVLGQKCETAELLDFMCQHGDTWVLCEDNETEYLVKMSMPSKSDPKDHILRYFGQNLEDRYRYRYLYDPKKVSEMAYSSYLTVYTVVAKNGHQLIQRAKNKRGILDALFDTRYSVNELVKTASEAEIHDFIYKTMFRNRELSSADSVIKVRSKSGLTKVMEDIERLLSQRKFEVEKIIASFNQTQKNILRIEYSQQEQPEDPNIAYWIFGKGARQNAYYKKLNITEDKVVQYFLSVLDQIGFLRFVELAINVKRRSERQRYEMIKFTNDFSPQMVDEGLSEITADNEGLIIDELFDGLITEENVKDVIEYLRNYVMQIEKFTLEFNINNNESHKSEKPIFKDVREVSLGQKVVAMLSFVLGYSDYIEDYRPLIVDQPEDNLDSQYIYKNLVAQLRETKKKRQIIIATHNATIVTNSMADQVCVMASDGRNGWIEAAGYPSERKIKGKILDYLEGGVKSFKHKMRTYETALK